MVTDDGDDDDDDDDDDLLIQHDKKIRWCQITCRPHHMVANQSSWDRQVWWAASLQILYFGSASLPPCLVVTIAARPSTRLFIHSPLTSNDIKKLNK